MHDHHARATSTSVRHAGASARRRCAAAAAAVAAMCGAGPAFAQGSASAPADDTAPCRDLLAAIPLLTASARPATAITRPDPQTCSYAPLRFAANLRFSYSIATMTVHGVAPSSTTGGAGAGKLQPSVRVEAGGIRIAPRGNPVVAYISKVGAIPFDIVLDYVNDHAARRFTLREFSMRGEAVGVLEIAADVTNVDVGDTPGDAIAAPPEIAAAGLRSFSLRLANHGFVEHMIVPALAGFLAAQAPGDDIEPMIDAQKTQIAATITTMGPQLGFAADTADALARFVSDFPHPTGVLRCHLASDPPLAIKPDTPPDPMALAQLVASAHPTCTYEHP